ncbi:ead/Ea22-like family protein [Serratia marcescens]|uniref:ead/Ea22-like family protein n=1 Tax=Serratia marcescens TaxID=615 RepID=UPI0030CCFF46
MMDNKLSELKAAAMAATPGPWAYEAYGDTGQYGVGVLLNENDEPQSGRQEQGEMLVVESVASLVNGAPNAAFIAVANPAVILALLAELEAKDKRIAEVEDSHKKLRETLAAVHNTITGGGAYTSLAGILTAVKRAYLESSDASASTFTVEGDEQS